MQCSGVPLERALFREGSNGQRSESKSSATTRAKASGFPGLSQMCQSCTYRRGETTQKRLVVMKSKHRRGGGVITYVCM